MHKILVVDNIYGKTNPHWRDDTKNIQIVKRVYFDEKNFEEKCISILANNIIDFIAFCGKGSSKAATQLDLAFDTNEQSSLKKIKKIIRIQNTNSSEKKVNFDSKQELYKKGNRWLKEALEYNFDIIFVQTYGDEKIINKVLDMKKAYWVPYSNNNNIFYHKGYRKIVDVGMYFKVQRHPKRKQVIEYVTKICEKNNWNYEFSDKYWGKEYADAIARCKVLIHFSYCGDIPYRLYEAAAVGTCLLTDELHYGIEKLFKKSSYIVFKRDLSDIEEKIKVLLEKSEERKRIENSALFDIEQNSWEIISEKYIVPILSKERN